MNAFTIVLPLLQRLWYDCNNICDCDCTCLHSCDCTPACVDIIYIARTLSWRSPASSVICAGGRRQEICQTWVRASCGCHGPSTAMTSVWLCRSTDAAICCTIIWCAIACCCKLSIWQWYCYCQKLIGAFIDAVIAGFWNDGWCAAITIVIFWIIRAATITMASFPKPGSTDSCVDGAANCSACSTTKTGWHWGKTRPRLKRSKGHDCCHWSFEINQWLQWMVKQYSKRISKHALLNRKVVNGVTLFIHLKVVICNTSPQSIKNDAIINKYIDYYVDCDATKTAY